MPMRIGIDARWIFEQISGIGTYTHELIRHLAQIDRNNEYVLFFDNDAMMHRVSQATHLTLAPNFRTELLPFGIFSVRGQLQLPSVFRRLNLDVFHSPNYMIPLRAFPRNRPGRPRCVVTIHDLIPLIFPQHTPKALKSRFFPVYRRLMAEVAARADVILTVSNSSRKDVIEQFRILAPRQDDVIAVPNGVAPEYVAVVKPPRAPKTILYVGRFDPYKNVPKLMEAFARLRQIASFDVRLKVVGPPDPRYPEGQRRAKELGLDPWIDWAGYAADGALVTAYQQADLFVLLSKYEGFGLTLLEAMACGTPVVCSNRSSLPEVAGDAALLVDPDDTEAAAQAMARALSDDALRADLRAKGLKQAMKFTWTRTAAMTMKAYEQAVAL